MGYLRVGPDSSEKPLDLESQQTYISSVSELFTSKSEWVSVNYSYYDIDSVSFCDADFWYSWSCARCPVVLHSWSVTGWILKNTTKVSNNWTTNSQDKQNKKLWTKKKFLHCNLYNKSPCKIYIEDRYVICNSSRHCRIPIVFYGSTPDFLTTK